MSEFIFTGEHFERLRLLLTIMKEKNASDLHMSNGLPPMVRESGRLVPINKDVLRPEDTKNLVYSILNPNHREVLEKSFSADLAISIPEIGRFRVHAYYQRGTITSVFRRLYDKIPQMEVLGLPSAVHQLCNLRDGLVLVTGATGSGKSTTLAAIIQTINATYSRNIITIEDPIEYIHNSNQCIINQRELYTDVDTFSNALRGALRADPDIILVGEMRDLDTIRTAIMAAETGHLVFSTLHSRDAVSSISRLIGVFGADEQPQIRHQLSVSLKWVVSQQLLTRKDLNGVALAAEVMQVTPAISNLIRQGKQEHIYMAIETGMHLGMQTMEQSLADLVREDRIALETAERSAKSIQALSERLKSKRTAQYLKK